MTADDDLTSMDAYIGSQMPVRVAEPRPIIESGSCLAWVESVALYRPGVLLVLSAVCSDEVRPAGGGTLRFDRWYGDDIVDIETELVLDDDLVAPSAVTEPATSRRGSSGKAYSLSGSSRPGQAETRFWLPTIPRQRLTVKLNWPAAGESGSLELDASSWEQQAIDVRALTPPS